MKIKDLFKGVKPGEYMFEEEGVSVSVIKKGVIINGKFISKESELKDKMDRLYNLSQIDPNKLYFKLDKIGQIVIIVRGVTYDENGIRTECSNIEKGWKEYVPKEGSYYHTVLSFIEANILCYTIAKPGQPEFGYFVNKEEKSIKHNGHPLNPKERDYVKDIIIGKKFSELDHSKRYYKYSDFGKNGYYVTIDKNTMISIHNGSRTSITYEQTQEDDWVEYKKTAFDIFDLYELGKKHRKLQIAGTNTVLEYIETHKYFRVVGQHIQHEIDLLHNTYMPYVEEKIEYIIKKGTTLVLKFE